METFELNISGLSYLIQILLIDANFVMKQVSYDLGDPVLLQVDLVLNVEIASKQEDNPCIS